MGPVGKACWERQYFHETTSVDANILENSIVGDILGDSHLISSSFGAKSRNREKEKSSLASQP